MRVFFLSMVSVLLGIAPALAARERPNILTSARYSAAAQSMQKAPSQTQPVSASVSPTAADKIEVPAEVDELMDKIVTARNETEAACSGILSQLQDIQMLTGVTVTVSAIGTATGATSLVTGIMKVNADATVEELDKQIESLEKMDNAEWFSYLNALAEEKEEQEKKSKTLGNIRTIGLGATTVTSAASTVSSAFVVKKLELAAERIDQCEEKLASARNVKMEYEFAGRDTNDGTYTALQQIIETCDDMDSGSLEQIKNSMFATAIISGTGGVVALGGTVVSAIANTEKVRDDNSAKGRNTEKNLNLAANVSAGVSTGTSLGSTILSGISAYNLTKNAEAAAGCEENF